jgi:transposase
MAQPIKIELSEAQRGELERMRDRDPKAYKRERASAVLQAADGKSASEIARSGLLRPRYYETVSAWLKAYQEEGVAGFRIRDGRGRKPAFSP